ncbi:MAG: hypothetical protein A3F84_16240 [Candidatus Handelsmanbacteria bacterium RIFCSPLOWO2_12_FULL_64_10]|uniref:Uncharacterized protein n=1 Tax=Handelsmanbacteria sp. (strain RIFCSPLOWO2_12_FULL_64_10) TaxID=1817868 RepID=A0A1F6CJ64_HANXR|nr:MAG: hypothetical protein A3F84_16240 [Candidatus Handelsmanbacteria bacterium RIFCSPLOWO2_12_FULL_64_10]
MESPLDHMKESAVAGHRPIDRPELPGRGYVFTVVAGTETMPGEAQLKLGRYHRFEVYCDEPEFMGGEFKHPTPLGYLALGVGF